MENPWEKFPLLDWGSCSSLFLEQTAQGEQLLEYIYWTSANFDIIAILKLNGFNSY